MPRPAAIDRHDFLSFPSDWPARFSVLCLATAWPLLGHFSEGQVATAPQTTAQYLYSAEVGKVSARSCNKYFRLFREHVPADIEGYSRLASPPSALRCLLC